MASNPETSWRRKKPKPRILIRGFGFLWHHDVSGFDVI